MIDLEELREFHQKADEACVQCLLDGEWVDEYACTGCDNFWPCETYQLVAELTAARKVVAASETLHKMILFVGLKDDGANGNVESGIDEGHVLTGRAIRNYETVLAEYNEVEERELMAASEELCAALAAFEVTK